MAQKRRRPDDIRTITTVVRKKDVEGDPASGGQSGDLQGLTEVEGADSESVRELVEEGQYFEAEVVNGVENAPPADAGPVKVHKRREDDLPPEYTDVPPDDLEKRLIELGFIEGALVEVLHQGPFGGDPIAVRVNGVTIALRRREAMAILVKSNGSLA